MSAGGEERMYQHMRRSLSSGHRAAEVGNWKTTVSLPASGGIQTHRQKLRMSAPSRSRTLHREFVGHLRAGENENEGVQAEVYGRQNIFTSIWRKMQKKHLAFDIEL